MNILVSIFPYLHFDVDFTRNTKFPCAVLFDRDAASVGSMNGSSGVARATAAGPERIGRSFPQMPSTQQSNRSSLRAERTTGEKRIEIVEENRTHLETLAQSDFPAKWIAEAILNGVEKRGERS